MDRAKLTEVFLRYDALLQDAGVTARRHSRNLPAGSCAETLAHSRFMVQQSLEFIEQGRIEKAFRWLGFVQGVLWSQRLFTVEQLADHNKPTP